MRFRMWLVRIGFASACGLPAALAQATGSIEGVVTDSATQSPVRKAQVMLLPRGGQLMGLPAGGSIGPRPIGASRVSDPSMGQLRGQAQLTMPQMQSSMGQMRPPMPQAQPSVVVTDAGGSFAFRDLAPGRYAVQVHHPRYPMRPSGPVMSEVEVKASEASRVTVSLVPGASITGRIVDEDDDPITGCSVQLRAPAGAPLALRGVNFETQPSNERGEYRVHRLSAGKYIAVVQCMRPVFQPRPFSSGPPPPPTLGYPPQYYPQAADLQSAAVIEVAAGTERTGIDFRLKPTRVYAVSGSISGIEPGDGRNVSVMLAPPDQQSGFGMRSGRVDPATGGFVLQGVLPGSYILTANQPPTNPQAPPATAWQPVDVTDRSLQVNLMMQKAVDIPGAIIVEGDRSVPPQQVHIQIMTERPSASSMPPRVEMQPDGTFSLKNVLPGVWRLAAFGPNVFLRAIEAGGQTLQGQILDTSKGMPGSLRFFVSTRTATVQAKGNPGLMYTFMQDGDTLFPRPHVSQADPQGAVKVEGLAPGKYKVYEGTLADDATLLQTLTLAEGVVAELDLSKRPTSANGR